MFNLFRFRIVKRTSDIDNEDTYDLEIGRFFYIKIAENLTFELCKQLIKANKERKTKKSVVVYWE